MSTSTVEKREKGGKSKKSEESEKKKTMKMRRHASGRMRLTRRSRNPLPSASATSQTYVADVSDGVKVSRQESRREEGEKREQKKEREQDRKEEKQKRP